MWINIFLIILGTSIWVLYDTKKIGVRKGLVKGIGNMGPWGWFFSTLGLFFISFPVYLYYRDKFKIAVAMNIKKAEQEIKKCPKCAELVKKDALVCRFCHFEFPAFEKKEDDN